VIRQPDPKDGRGALYSLSSAGMEMTQKVRAAGHAVNDQAMRGLSEAEQQAYLDLLGKVVGNLSGGGES